MDVHATIDWYRYTARDGVAMTEIVPYMLSPLQENRIKPLPYYTHALPLEPAGRIDWNTINPAQGLMVTFTGGDLRTLEAEGIDRTYLIEETIKNPACKPTRIDLAIDLLNTEADPDDLYNAWKEKQVKTRARECNQVRGLCKETFRTGNTVYIGNREGETYLRAYDKGVEKHIEDMLWLRLEAELKAGKARVAAQSVAQQGIAATAKAAINKYIKFPKVAWWQEMLASLPEADETMITAENHNKGESKEWLYKQALPAVLRAIAKNDPLAIKPIEAALNEIRGGNFFTCE